MKSILTLTALIEVFTGLALVTMPSFVVSILLGTSLTEINAILIARLAGAALITIAIACWLSRSSLQSAVLIKAMHVFSVALLFTQN